MKKIKLGVITTLIVCLLSGCSNQLSLSDEDTDMFAEYISKELLAYHKNYDQGLLIQEGNTEKVETDVDEQAQVEQIIDQGNNETENDNTTVTDVTGSEHTKLVTADLNEVLGNKKVDVSYKTSKVYDSYPANKDNYFVINSVKGYQLLVVSFQLKNTSSSKSTYNMLNQDIEYTLTLSDGKKYNPLLTLLVDDMQFINMTISGEDSKRGVLVFRVPKEVAKSKGTLQIVNGNKKATVDVNN